MPDQLAWGLRMLLISGGSWLAGRGIGDAGLWQELAPLAVAAAGAAWSFLARRKAAPAP